MFIGLNPSKADEKTDDATIRKCIGFAKRWGYGGIFMGNLFTLVSTDPNLLLTIKTPLESNDQDLKDFAEKSAIVVFCWGAFKQAIERAKGVVQLFPAAYCLGKTKEGFPKHPCRIAYATQLEKFNQE